MYEWYKANGSTDLTAKKITELKFYTGAQYGGNITVKIYVLRSGAYGCNRTLRRRNPLRPSRRKLSPLSPDRLNPRISPVDTTGITADNAVVTMENGALKIVADAATTVTIPVGKLITWSRTPMYM